MYLDDTLTADELAEANHELHTLREGIDLDTDRSILVAAFASIFYAELTHVTWYHHEGDRHVYTNVAPIAPTVVHFRAPIAGGTVEVCDVLGRNWTETNMSVLDFEFLRYDDDDWSPMTLYVAWRTKYSNAT